MLDSQRLDQTPGLIWWRGAMILRRGLLDLHESDGSLLAFEMQACQAEANFSENAPFNYYCQLR